MHKKSHAAPCRVQRLIPKLLLWHVILSEQQLDILADIVIPRSTQLLFSMMVLKLDMLAVCFVTLCFSLSLRSASLAAYDVCVAVLFTGEGDYKVISRSRVSGKRGMVFRKGQGQESERKENGGIISCDLQILVRSCFMLLHLFYFVFYEQLNSRPHLDVDLNSFFSVLILNTFLAAHSVRFQSETL